MRQVLHLPERIMSYFPHQQYRMPRPQSPKRLHIGRIPGLGARDEKTLDISKLTPYNCMIELVTEGCQENGPCSPEEAEAKARLPA